MGKERFLLHLEDLEQTELDIGHCLHCHHPLFKEEQLGVEYELHAGVGANEDMSGCFRVVTTARASGIVSIAPKAHYFILYTNDCCIFGD